MLQSVIKMSLTHVESFTKWRITATAVVMCMFTVTIDECDLSSMPSQRWSGGTIIMNTLRMYFQLQLVRQSLVNSNKEDRELSVWLTVNAVVAQLIDVIVDWLLSPLHHVHCVVAIEPGWWQPWHSQWTWTQRLHFKSLHTWRCYTHAHTRTHTHATQLTHLH